MTTTLAAVLLASRLMIADPLAEQLVNSHVRALLTQHSTDVASSDRHTVKPWFQGRLDFAPTVRDFVADGYPLVGGRLDYVAERPVAALVYRRGAHLIDVFVWPDSRAAPTFARSDRQGYHVLGWSRRRPGLLGRVRCRSGRSAGIRPALASRRRRWWRRAGPLRPGAGSRPRVGESHDR